MGNTVAWECEKCNHKATVRLVVRASKTNLDEIKKVTAKEKLEFERKKDEGTIPEAFSLPDYRSPEDTKLAQTIAQTFGLSKMTIVCLGQNKHSKTDYFKQDHMAYYCAKHQPNVHPSLFFIWTITFDDKVYHK